MKKLFSLSIIALSVCLLFFLNSNISFAQTETPVIRDLDKVVADYEEEKPQNYNPQNLDLGTNPDVPVNLSTYTQSALIEILSSGSCLLSGVDPVRPGHPCLGFDSETKKLGYVENTGGALGMMGGLIAMTYDIPASSGDYIRYMAGNFGITQNALAVFVDSDICVDNPSLCSDNNSPTISGFGTGKGFAGLTPVLGIWTAMRNIVYLLFVLVFIILGLGIMFRIQIDPRAVMSVQAQLPKVVIALILVTFSYAIAGFLVDMMYLSLFLIISIFQSQGLEVSTSLSTNPINGADGIGGIGGIAFDASKGIAGTLTSLFDGTFGTILKGMINTIFGGLMGAGIGAGIGAVGGPIGMVAGGLIGATIFGIGSTFGIIPGPEPFTLVVGLIAWIIIIIALLSALFRLWFTLIKTYVYILISITFAPIWIVFGLFPGSSLSFGGWIRSLVANLAAFPLVLILFSLGKTLQNGFSKAGPEAFVPPYVGDPGNMSAFGSIIGMGMILLAPEAVNIMKSALKSPEFKYTSAVGRSLGFGRKMATIPPSLAWSRLTHQDPMHADQGGAIATWASDGGTGVKLSAARKITRGLLGIRKQ